MQAVAQQYIDQGIVVIPLSKKGDGKGVHINQWESKEFEAKDFGPENNIGWNIGLSKKRDLDCDSKNAVYFAPKFLTPTRTLGIKSPKGFIARTHYFYNANGTINYIGRKYPNGNTIAELRQKGNTVVAPSIAESKLFDKQWCERVWTDDREFADNPNLVKQFNKICIASVLQTVIESNNMPFVKLTACLKRYCIENGDWSEDELYEFIKIVSNSILNKKGESIFEWNDVKAKVKTVLNNWKDPKTHQSGYESFANEVGLKRNYCRDMFTWIGEIPKEESKTDRKTIIDFVAMGMKEADFHKKVERTYLVSPIICDVGLYVLAGRPKGGKSRALKDLAYKVQNPELGAWLGYTVMHGDVLLLALEDNEDSMNLDIKGMGHQHRKKPTTFTEQCPTLERGFVESVKKWHEQMPNPKLVIVDTFQKIKPLGQQKTRNANSYEVDYHYLTQLHELAKELKICIIYVHHLSQADKGHKWDKIMGSTGHQACTDAMYMLEREESGYKGKLSGIGRNIAGFEINIEWNTNLKQPFTFQYAGNSYQVQTEKHKRDIYLAMKQLEKDDKINVKPADVYKVLNLITQKEKNSCNKNMQRMKDRGELRQGDAFGEYCLAVDVSRIDDHGNIKIGEDF
jgi:hypothetical protein|tara:strand:- start:53 stop:1933 length:1881 start_codon:yes stop_codon:yes gene_type:complete